MNAQAVQAPTMRLPDRLRAVVERVLPWYDPAEAQARHAHTDAIVRQSKAAREFARRVELVAMRTSFASADDRLRR